MNKIKTVWCDFDNSPHVLLFLPIIQQFEKNGFTALYTARDVAQTVQLLNDRKIEFLSIGEQFPNHKFGKFVYTICRGVQLFLKLRKENITFLICSSRSALLAAWLMKKPVYFFLDYEYVESNLLKWFASAIFVPEVVANGIRGVLGLSTKVIGYPGIKEQIYLPDPGTIKSLKLDIENDKILVTIRTPAQSHYAVQQSYDLFENILDYFSSRTDIHLILSPRYPNQVSYLKERLKNASSDVTIIENPMPGLELIITSDLILSGGGTMIREAAVLGVPAYSFFRGKEGLIDLWLEKEGRLTFIRKPDDIQKIGIKKKTNFNILYPNNNQIIYIYKKIISFLYSNKE